MKIVSPYIRRSVVWARQHQLVSGIAAVIGITFLFTAVSMSLYVSSGASGLDLSRPGFDAARKDIATAQSTSVFSSSGKLTQSDIDTFVKQFEEQRAKLRKIGAFDDQSLSDESLGLVMPASNTASDQ